MVVYTLEQRWEAGLRSTYRRWRFWQKKIIFSNEAHFDLGGYVNKQNCLIWGLCRRTQNESSITIVIGQCWTNFCSPKIEEKDIGNIWFQQDGATCHTAETTLDVLRPVFEDHIISRIADVVWPAAIWHRWTICGVPSKISFTPTS